VALRLLFIIPQKGLAGLGFDLGLAGLDLGLGLGGIDLGLDCFCVCISGLYEKEPEKSTFKKENKQIDRPRLCLPSLDPLASLPLLPVAFSFLAALFLAFSFFFLASSFLALASWAAFLVCFFLAEPASGVFVGGVAAGLLEDDGFPLLEGPRDFFAADVLETEGLLKGFPFLEEPLGFFAGDGFPEDFLLLEAANSADRRGFFLLRGPLRTIPPRVSAPLGRLAAFSRAAFFLAFLSLASCIMCSSCCILALLSLSSLVSVCSGVSVRCKRRASR
jgi:hypothetical protein